MAISERHHQAAGRAIAVAAARQWAPAHWLSLLLLALLLMVAPPAQAQEEPLVGQWDWGAGGGIVELYADGTGHDSNGNTVQWGATGPSTYSLVWSHGYTDRAELSADGNSIELVNNTGLQFSATRRGPPRQADVGVPLLAAADIAGKWKWSITSGEVDFFPDGTGQDNGGHTMTWVLTDPATRTYTLTWSHGYTDRAVLSPDGNSLALTNSSGASFNGTRIGGSAGGGVAAPLDLNGSMQRNLLHISKDGARVLVTASWKRVDGKYVIWRGEGTLSGNVVELEIEYSPMAHGPQPIWHGRYVVSADGNGIDATYTTSGGGYDHQVYARDP